MLAMARTRMINADLRLDESTSFPSLSIRLFLGCGSSTYVHCWPCTAQAAQVPDEPSFTTHLLFRFRQASQGRSLRPLVVLVSLTEPVRFGFEVEESPDRWLEGGVAVGTEEAAGRRGG